MLVIGAVLAVFVVLEIFQLPTFQREAKAPVPKSVRVVKEDPILIESSYETGNRMIHLFCIAMIGSTYYCLGAIGTLFALVPIFMVAAALDAFWIRLCLQRTPLAMPQSRSSRRASRERKSRAAR